MFPLMNEKSVKMQLNLIVPTPDTHMTFPHSSYFLTSPPLSQTPCQYKQTYLISQYMITPLRLRAPHISPLTRQFLTLGLISYTLRGRWASNNLHILFLEINFGLKAYIFK